MINSNYISVFFQFQYFMPRHELGHRHLLVKKTILNVINGHKNEDGGERPEMPNQVSISSTFYSHFFCR